MIAGLLGLIARLARLLVCALIVLALFLIALGLAVAVLLLRFLPWALRLAATIAYGLSMLWALLAARDFYERNGDPASSLGIVAAIVSLAGFIPVISLKRGGTESFLWAGMILSALFNWILSQLIARSQGDPLLALALTVSPTIIFGALWVYTMLRLKETCHGTNERNSDAEKPVAETGGEGSSQVEPG